jgi:DNA topoisomerase-1
MTQLERLQKTGIRRIGSPKAGFRYETAQGKAVNAADLDRVESLRIPPAWTEVAIHPSPRGMLQAVGKDAAGRWQYLYHAAHVQRREQKKYEKIVHFAQALPKMRRTVGEHLKQPGLGKEKVLACILRILSTVFIRPGSEVYASENGSYGIATIRKKHVEVKGDVVHLDFPGKSGKRQQRELRDRRVARIVRELLKLPGYEVFKFMNEEGQLVDVKRRHINQYIKEVMGERFSAKDFRTWAGTLICACALARAGADGTETKTARRKKVVSAVKETAEQLGNTPAICRASYIYPAVLNSFERGRVVGRYFENVEELVEHHTAGLHGSEKALLQLLKQKAV